jgi:hypothetical protein
VKKEWEFDMNLNELKLFCSKRGNRHFVVVQKKHAFVKLKCCNIGANSKLKGYVKNTAIL